VGETRLRQLQALGLSSLWDLLHYFPRDYQYRSAETTIDQLQPNTIATARGEVVAVDYIPGPRPRFEMTLQDSTGKLAVTFFNGAYLRTRIHPGMKLKVMGKLRVFRNLPQMQNPKWAVLDTEELEEGTDGAKREKDRFLPVYPASGRLTTDVLAKLVESALPLAVPAIPETLPEGLLGRRELLPRRRAYELIHRPESKEEALSARKRLVYDELFVMQIGLALSRRQMTQGKMGAPILRCDRVLDERIRKRFPFEMTRGQLAATYEILRDLSSGRPMNRLLQGDVGSGKTAVALYAMLVAVANRMQAALLAPTEVLAEQHYLTLSTFLKDSAVTVELFTSRTKRQSRGGLLRALGDGRIHLAVGTQALLSQDISFANLGLVVVDEQHRLGVRQRATLRGKAAEGTTDDVSFAHYLVMTATPIPRTLALSYFADFDLSIIDELPPGRLPVDTRWVKGLPSSPAHAKAWDFVRKQIGMGHQAYVVVPQIGESEDDGDDSASLLKEAKRLGEGPLKGLRLATLHGQMAADEKQAVMSEFREGKRDILLATTVIEVGIDVPNATVICILDADRFGLSQLHQLRGRVGRGGNQSFCLLFSDADQRGPAGDAAATRLTALTQNHSGFEIAEIDLRLRGPGEFFGTRQHGLPEFRLADLTEETQLLHEAREDAQWLLKLNPNLKGPELTALREEISREFADALPLATVG
jgi:ATP-dependent DNA helicase RecG